MQLIDCISSNLTSKKDIGIARFSHEFYPTATGDNIQAMGHRTVLIESGGYRNDPDRLVARKLVFEALFRSFFFIAKDQWKNGSVKNYLEIPMNDTKLFDLLIRNVQLTPNSVIRADIGIEITESYDKSLSQILYKSTVKDIGDLSSYSGYSEVDGSNGHITKQVGLNQKADFDIIFEKTATKISTIFVRNGYKR